MPKAIWSDWPFKHHAHTQQKQGFCDKVNSTSQNGRRILLPEVAWWAGKQERLPVWLGYTLSCCLVVLCF